MKTVQDFSLSFEHAPSGAWIATTIQPALIADDAHDRTKFFDRRFGESAPVNSIQTRQHTSAHTGEDRDVERPKQGECHEENCSCPLCYSIPHHAGICRFP